MNRIWWIMGGTAVGKKHFIQLCVERGDFLGLGIDRPVPTWIEDGDPDIDELFAAMQKGDALIRWQHGREELIKDIKVRDKKAKHFVIVITADPATRERRATQREGRRRWTALNLHRESRRVENTADRLARLWLVPIFYIDTTSGYRVVDDTPCEGMAG